MRRGTHLYPFRGKMVTLSDISRYYNNKGIELNHTMFTAEVKKVADKVGRENITEEQVLNSVKNTLCKKNLGTVLPEHRENCIKEFGQDFWNDVVARKTAIGQARKARLESAKKFRESMKVDLNQTPEVKITEKNIIEREVKDGGAR